MLLNNKVFCSSILKCSPCCLRSSERVLRKSTRFFPGLYGESKGVKVECVLGRGFVLGGGGGVERDRKRGVVEDLGEST